MAGTIQRLADRVGFRAAREDAVKAPQGNTPIGLVYKFTADASAATYPTLTIENIAGYIAGYDIVFDGTTPPNNLDVSMQTQDGIELAATADATASAREIMFDLTWVAGNLVFVCDDNTTNSAVFTLILYVE